MDAEFFTEIEFDAMIATHCRTCASSALVPLFSLGNLCLCNAFPEPGEQVPRSPLDLILCDPRDGGCGLVQLRHSVAAELMYTRYWYKSGLSVTMRAHLEGLVRKAELIAALQPTDVVLDVGCNDGTTLRAYRMPTLRRIGFEPSQLAEEAEAGTTTIVRELFNAEAFRAAVGNAHARVITSIAMFYDLDDPGAFVDAVRQCLAPDGIWIIEMHYLPAMLASNGFDAIVHEHVAYYSLGTLRALLVRHGMRAFDVEFNPMNGGSMRVYVCHQTSDRRDPTGATACLAKCAQDERVLALDQPQTYQRLWKRIERLKNQVRSHVVRSVERGERVFVYGASTKGNAVLQVFELDRHLITGAGDINSDKWGRETPGTRIPIVSPEVAAHAKPDVFLVLIWHLIEEVREQWRSHLEAGGRLLVPLPRMRWIESPGSRVHIRHASPG